MKQSASLSATARLAQSAKPAIIFVATALLALPAFAVDSTPTINASPSHAAAGSAAPSAGSSSLTMLFGLLLILGLIVCVAWLVKRSGLAPAMQASAAAKVVGGVNVGNRERVVVVEVADQWIVVGVAPGRVNALATMPKQESLPADVVPAAKNFSSWMKQTIEKRNAPR